MSCLICGDEDPVKTITCGRLSCGEQVCAECGDNYMQHCRDDSKIPACLSSKCSGGIYLHSDVHRLLGPLAARAYESAVYDSLTKQHTGSINEEAEKKIMLERIRQERLQFISQTFPKAVEIVARIVCQDKLRRVEKSQAQRAERRIRDAKRICMNMACNGHMTDEFKCLKCETQFCSRCEKRLEANHVCNEQDLQSLEVIRGLVQCPNCHLRVQRSDGCRNMTCVYCKTNFDYYTGEKAVHGAHGNKDIKLTEQVRLSSAYVGTASPDVLDLCLKLEAMEPTEPSDAKIRKIIERIPADENDAAAEREKTGRRLCRALEQKTRAQYYRQVYYRATAELETIMQSKTDDKLDRLQRLVDMVESAVPSQARRSTEKVESVGAIESVKAVESVESIQSIELPEESEESELSKLSKSIESEAESKSTVTRSRKRKLDTEQNTEPKSKRARPKRRSELTE